MKLSLFSAGLIAVASYVAAEDYGLRATGSVLKFGNATASDALLLNEELERTSVVQSCVKKYVNGYLRKSEDGRKTKYRHVPFKLRGNPEKWEGDCSSFVYRVIEQGCGNLINKIWKDQFRLIATCSSYPSQDKIDKGWFWPGDHCTHRVRADGFRKAIEKARQITNHGTPVPRNQMYRFENAKKIQAYDLIGYTIKDTPSCRTTTDTGHVMFVKKIKEATSRNPRYGRRSVLVVDISKTGHGKDRRRGSSEYSGVGEGVIDIFYKKTSGNKVYVMGLAGDNANNDPETALTKNVRCHTYFMARFGPGGTVSGLEDDESFIDTFNATKFEIE